MRVAYLYFNTVCLNFCYPNEIKTIFQVKNRVKNSNVEIFSWLIYSWLSKFIGMVSIVQCVFLVSMECFEYITTTTKKSRPYFYFRFFANILTILPHCAPCSWYRNWSLLIQILSQMFATQPDAVPGNEYDRWKLRKDLMD